MKRAEDERAGCIPKPEALLVHGRKRVASTKRAWQRLSDDLGLEGFTQKSFRYFMAEQTKMIFRRIPREQRSAWLGRVVRDGSRTTGYYEGQDPMALIDVALATDCIMSLLAERCSRKLFAIEMRLTADDLLEVGARVLPKNAVNLMGGPRHR